MRFIFIDNNKKKNTLTFTKKGEYVVLFLNYSGEVYLDFRSEGVKTHIFGLYIGKSDDNFNLKTTQHHRVKNSYSNLLVKGVFSDNSKFLYDGLIRIEKGAQLSHAYQKNQNLILSDDVFVESRPFLEIMANNVFCTHGSVTFGLNKEELYYLYSRGLNRESSEKLLSNGFINEICERIKGLKMSEKDYAEIVDKIRLYAKC